MSHRNTPCPAKRACEQALRDRHEIEMLQALLDGTISYIRRISHAMETPDAEVCVARLADGIVQLKATLLNEALSRCDTLVEGHSTTDEGKPS